MNLVARHPLVPEYTVEPVVREVSPGGISTVTVGDAILTRSSGATVATEAEVTPDVFEPVEWSSQTPAIATVDGLGRVTRVANGTARIIARCGLNRQLLRVPVSQATATIDTWKSWVADSLPDELTREIDAMIAGRNPSSSALNLFSTANHATGSYTRSGTVWCAPLHAALAAVSVWSPASGTHRPLTALTPRHAVCNVHHGDPLGTMVRWVLSTGAVVERMVVATSDLGHDIRLGLLDADLPEAIAPVMLPPSNLAALLPQVSWGIPVLHRNQYGEARIQEMNHIGLAANGSNKIKGFQFLLHPPRQPWWRQVVGGDSSGPLLMVRGGELILLTTFWTPTGGSAYQHVDFAAAIAALDASAEVDTGHEVTVADFS